MQGKLNVQTENILDIKDFACECKVQIVVPVPKEVKVGTRTITKQDRQIKS